MSFFSRLLLIVISFSASSFGAALNRDAFTFTKYDLEVRVNPEERAAAARGKITLRNDSDQPQKLAVLQISSTLEWRMIQIAGNDVEYVSQPFTSDLDHTGKLNEAVVTLPAPVAPKNTVEIEVGYSGTITKDATRLTRIGVPEARAVASDWDRVGEKFTGVRGIGHVAWYPISSDAANLSENSLFSTIAQWQQRELEAQMKTRFCWITEEDHSFTVVANGVFEGIGGGIDGGQGNRTGCTSYSFRNLSQTVPTFVVGQFEMLTRPLSSFYYLDGNEGAASDYAIAAEKVAPWLEEWFGKPVTKIEVVEIPDRDAAPFDAGTMLFTPLNTGNKRAVEAAMAHQLTHASVQSRRPWISEGLAQFAQALIRERQDGRRAALDFMREQLPALIAAEKQNTDGAKPSGDATQSLVNTSDEIYYRVKAMYVWWMLRDMVGDVPLQVALKGYRAEQDKDASYVQRLLSAQSKRDLEWFFDDWVYRDRGLPVFQVVSAPARETLNNSHVVAVTIEDAGGAGGEVPVTVTADTGARTERVVVRGRQRETTRISVPGKPVEVLVNDGSVPVAEEGKARLEIK
jgi:hypothetical protein